MTEKPPIRRCDGCGAEDDHPRFVYADLDGDLLFHNDCVPLHIVRKFPGHPVIGLRAEGHRGDALREAVVAHVENSEDAR